MQSYKLMPEFSERSKERPLPYPLQLCESSVSVKGKPWGTREAGFRVCFAVIYRKTPVAEPFSSKVIGR